MGRRFDPDRAHDKNLTSIGLFRILMYLNKVTSLEMIKASKVITLTLLLTTLVVSPGFTSDPINWVKLSVCATGVTCAFALVFMSGRNSKFIEKNSTLAGKSLIFLLLGLALSFLFSDSNKTDDLYGVYGRANGMIAICSLVAIFFIAQTISFDELFSNFHKYFVICLSMFTMYLALQFLGKDPVDWSRNETFGTLGNINYSSAFIGMSVTYTVGWAFMSKSPRWLQVLCITFGLVTLSMIFQTGSIQGIFGVIYSSAIFASVKIFRSGQISNLLRASSITLVNVLGFAVIYVASRKDMLGGIFYQETLAFRRDYIIAGIRMFKENLFFGVGINNYGEWYRYYRDNDAALRTLGDRTSNSAHSIFVDVAAGAGIIPAISLIVFVLVASRKAILALNTSIDFREKILSLLWLNYVPQFAFGILNLGTAVWAWLAVGALFGSRQVTNQKLNASSVKKRLQSQVIPQKNLSKVGELPKNSLLGAGVFIRTLVMTTTIGLISVLPAINDSMYFAASKRGDLTEMLKIAQSSLSTSSLMEQTLEKYVQNSDPQTILSIALQTVETYPRSYYGWTVISQLAITPDGLRANAIRELKSLNPYL